MTWEEQEAAALLRNGAKRILAKTDFVHAKAEDEGLTINPEWKVWRTQVRRIAGGEATGPIPDEPERWIVSKSE